MSDLKVVPIDGSVTSVEEVLKAALEAGLSEVVVVGWVKGDGGLYMSQSCRSIGESFHLVEAYKFETMAGCAGLVDTGNHLK